MRSIAFRVLGFALAVVLVRVRAWAAADAAHGLQAVAQHHEAVHARAHVAPSSASLYAADWVMTAACTTREGTLANCVRNGVSGPKMGPKRQRSSFSSGRVAVGSASEPQTAAKKYAATRKYGRRHEMRSQGSKLAVFSPDNPDEEDTVLHAQLRIRAARASEQSLQRRLWGVVNALLGSPWVLSHEATPILDHVSLGGRENASDHEELLRSGFTHVCNCALQVDNYFEGEFVYLKLHLHDSQEEDLMPHFQTVNVFLKRVERLRGRALIHCVSGVSRSPALLVAHLMIHKRMPLLQAYTLVRSKRRAVQPNQQFRLQLAKFEIMLFGVSSVARTQDKDWDFFAWNEMKSTGQLQPNK